MGGGRFSLSSADASIEIEFNHGSLADRLVINEPVAVPDGRDFYAAFYRDGGAQALADLRRHQMPRLVALAGLDAATREVTHLDVGCGSGIAVDYLNRHCRNVRSYGIDPGLPHDQPPLYRVAFEDLERVASIPAAFDVISFLDVLEHFQNPLPALHQARARLNPGGVLLIKVPTRSALIYQGAKQLRHLLPALSRGVFRRLYQVDYMPAHHYYFDLRSLASLLDQAGFVIDRHAYVTEIPLAHLWTRLWGMRLPVKAAAFACLLPLKALSTHSRSECLAVIASPRA